MSPLPSDPSDPCHVDTVLGSVIQPLLQACRIGGQTLAQGDMAIFMLNNVSAIQVGFLLRLGLVKWLRLIRWLGLLFLKDARNIAIIMLNVVSAIFITMIRVS
jgi:hypothetical protein